MREVHENPADPLGSLGPAIKPATPARPDPVRQFEQASDLPLISDHSKALESIADTLRKKHDRDEPTGCDFGDYTLALLGCI